MCGRYSGRDIEKMAYTISLILGVSYEKILEMYRDPKKARRARFNIAPAQNNVVVAPDGTELPGIRDLKWGHFASFSPEGPPTFLINARSETALQKRTFSRAMKERRCLVPADGFYEWKRDARGRSQQAYYFQRKGGAAYVMAGLRWPAEGDQPERYIVLTTAPNELLEPIHDRMPVILPDEAARRWIDPALTGEQARELCRTFPASEMTGHPVSTIVNSAKNDVPECVVPVLTVDDARGQQTELF